MAIGFRGITEIASGTAADPMTAPALPASTADGDMVLLFVQVKYGDAVTINTPTDWGLVSDTTVANSGLSTGNDSGNMRCAVFWRIKDAGWSTMPAVDLSTTPNSTMRGAIAYSKGASETWDTPVGASAADNSASATGIDPSAASTTLSLGSGDWLVSYAAINGDIAATVTHTTTVSGVTFGSSNVRLNATTSSGSDQRGHVIDQAYSSGTASAGPDGAASLTAGGAGTAGVMAFVQLSLAGDTAVSGSESHTLTDATSTLHVGSTSSGSVDTATATDAKVTQHVGSTSSGSVDTGTAADALVTLTATGNTTDTGTLAEQASSTATFSSSDSATLSESSSVSLAVTGSDSGTLTEGAVTISASTAISGTDSGSLAEGVPAVAQSTTDSGALTELSSSTATSTSSDSGSLAEGVPAVAQSTSDSATLSELSTITTSGTSSDSGTLTEANQGIAQTTSDSGTLSELSSSTATINATDTGTLSEASTLDTGSAPFSPTDIAGLVWWIDPSDTGSVTSSGGLVSQINDLSASGFHATQATNNNKPHTGSTINGLDALAFNTASAQAEYLSFTRPTASASSTVFFVLDSNGDLRSHVLADTNGRVFAWRSGQTTGAVPNPSAGVTFRMSRVDVTFAHVGDAYDRIGDIPILITAIDYDWSGRLDPTNTSTTGATDGLGGGTVDSLLGEVLIYDTVLSAGDIADVEQYLTEKWDTTYPAIDDDTGTLAESAGTTSSATVTDSGTLTEVASVDISYAAIDSATLAEQAAVTVVVPASDSGSLSESASLTVTLVAADSGTLTEQGSASEAVTVTSSDSGTLTDVTVSVGIEFPGVPIFGRITEGATLVSAGSVTSGTATAATGSLTTGSWP